MKALVIFAAVIFCAQAIQIPIHLSSESASSEEVLQIVAPSQGQGLSGVGVISQPYVQAVKVKVPRYASGPLKQQLIDQALGIRGINLQARQARQAGGSKGPTKVVSDAPKVSGDSSTSDAPTKAPVVGDVTKAPVGNKSN